MPLITSMYSSLSEPTIPVPAEVTAITGLNNELLAGQQINWQVVRGYLSKAAVVIAHNMDFDRAFLQRRPEVQDLDLHWACSVRHIDWQSKGFTARRLTHLAADHGFINPFPHRALFDCATTFRVMAPHLQELVNRSYERQILIRAVGAAFETKDKLKARGYRWNAKAYVWEKQIFESGLTEERSFLTSDIYSGEPRHEEQHLL